MTSIEHLRAAAELEQIAGWHRAQAGSAPNAKSDRQHALDLAAAAIDAAQQQGLPLLKNRQVAKAADKDPETFRRDYSDDLKARGFECTKGCMGGWRRIRGNPAPHIPPDLQPPPKAKIDVEVNL